MQIQIALDCQDPHAQAAFWASALHYEVEDHTRIVDSLLAGGQLTPDQVIDTDTGRGFADVAACRDPEGRQPRLFLHRVPEPKTGKIRQHLDLQVGAEQAPAEVQRLIRLGATEAWVSTEGGMVNTTLRDPEGNEFCVS